MVVTEKAIIARVNRKLAANLERLRKPRTERARLDVGELCIFDMRQRFVTETHVDLSDLAMELGALNPGEIVDADKPAS